MLKFIRKFKNPNKILVVEDYGGIIDNFKDFLKKRNFQIVTSAEEGLEAVLTYKPSIIFLDFNLPEKNGGVFAEIVRTDARYAEFSNVPIIGVGDFPRGQRQNLTRYVDKMEIWRNLNQILEEYALN